MEKAASVTIVESDYWKALINLNRNQNQMLNSILETKPDKETIAGESGNDINRTGWEDEREYAFGRKTDEQSVGETEEEMDSDILWNNDRNSSVLTDSFYFAGNLFKLINNQTHYHRKRIKLSQKEIEKRLAHGLKSDGYEEYEDYYNNELSM